MRRRTGSTGLGPRLLLAEALVIVTGGGTLLVVALAVAPGLFGDHVDRAAGPISADLRRHLDEAFMRATLISLGLAVGAALVTALAVSWFVTRRVVRPVRALAMAAERIAAGDYATRVGPTGAGSELDALGGAFNHMAATLAATERTRAELLRDLAHELRTPLTSVRGYVEALHDGVMAHDPSTATTLESELARIERLVDDIAMVSRAEERRLDLRRRPTELGELVGTAVAAAARAFADAGVTLTRQVHDEVTVLVDQDRMHQVLANLLDNARRHSPSGGRVTVTVRRVGDNVEIAVSDGGDGLTPEQRRRVFERFYRADGGRSRDRGGSGIGLTIARALVEAHGGRIRADSPGLGQGSTFTVTLPAAPGP